MNRYEINKNRYGIVAFSLRIVTKIAIIRANRVMKITNLLKKGQMNTTKFL